MHKLETFETLAFIHTWLYTHHHGGPPPGGNTLSRKLARLEHAGKGALQLADAPLHQLSEAGARVLTGNVSHQLRDHFSVGVRFEAETFSHEKLLDVLVVGNDAIVNN